MATSLLALRRHGAGAFRTSLVSRGVANGGGTCALSSGVEFGGDAVAAGRARLRRSTLFVPANERMDKFLAKALASDADSIVIDLEDSVAASGKATARAKVAAWLAASPDTAKEIVVRINGHDAVEDIGAVLQDGGRWPDALMVPKVGAAADLDAVDASVSARERATGRPEGRGVGVVAIATEVPAGVFNLPEIAGGPRVVAVTWGAEDIGVELGSSVKYVEKDGAKRYHPLFEHLRITTLLAARAAGVQALDGVYTDVRDGKGCASEASDAAAMGFDGKLALHPAQLDPLHRAFRVSEARRTRARRVVAALADGSGAALVDGEMVDRPHLLAAERLLLKAAAIDAAGGAPPERAVVDRPVKGLWLEDLEVGLVVEHALTRTVTETDNVLATTLSLNPAQLHLDHEAARATQFKRPLVNSMFTLSLLIGISVHETTHGTTIANLGMDKVAFPAPMFHGDTLTARTTVVGNRASKTRSDRGVVTFLHEGFNQDGTLVATCERAALMLARP